MRAIDLAVKDLKQLVRDWKTATFLVAMPVVFTLMFGFAFGGFGGGESDPRLPVGFVDQDGSRLSASLLELLNGSEAIRAVVLEGNDAEADRLDEQVRDQDLAAVVIVPTDYGQRLEAGDFLRLVVIADEATSAGSTARREIQAAAARLAGSVEAARLSIEHYARQVGFADQAAAESFWEEALDQTIAAWQDPPLTVAVTQSEAITTEEEGSPVMQSGFSHTSPSMMVQFAIAGLIGAASILVLERKSRALRRLLTTAISRIEIILGHYLAMVVIILAQLVILVAFGQLLLHVDYMRVPLATLLVMVTTALWTASLGLLIGTLAQTDDQVTIFSLIPMFVLAGMGGAWVPLEYTGKTFQAIGHLLPTAWAMDGFENIVIRGLGLESVLLPAAIMLAYAVVLFALAAWRFRFE
jgi:ABC-2 type transport system permease protein